MGNLLTPNANQAIGTSNHSPDVVPMSSLCTEYLDGCEVNSELLVYSSQCRAVIYAKVYSEMTSGIEKNDPID